MSSNIADVAALKHIKDNDRKLNFVGAELSKAITQDELNELLEYHLTCSNNTKISELLLRKGADPNFICKGYLAEQCPPINCNKSSFKQPLSINVVYQSYLHHQMPETIKLLPKKISLLIEYGLLIDSKSRNAITLLHSPRETPLIDLIAKLATYDEDNIKPQPTSAIRKTIVQLLEKGVGINAGNYNECRDIYTSSLKEMGGFFAIRELEKNGFDFNAFMEIINGLQARKSTLSL